MPRQGLLHGGHLRSLRDSAAGQWAHADYEEIPAWLSHFEAAPKMTFLTHGEPEAANVLGQRIHESLGWKVKMPAHGGNIHL
jgi:metallo-beta-lactamase family protein